jgi:hypothetical protein
MIAAEDDEAVQEDVEGELVPEEAVLAGLTETTLRDLVNKLRNEPWAVPEPEPSTPPPPATPELKIPDDPKVSVVDRHATKFPLGGGPQIVEALLSEAQKTETAGNNPPDSKQSPSPGKPSL